MKLSIKTIGLSSNLTLKILSIIFGYLFWLIFVQNQKINMSVDVPLYFYGLKDNIEIVAPENIHVTLSGKRIDLANIDIMQTIAIHVDASDYQQIGNHKIKLLSNDIFLQNKIKLIDYFPSEISIQIKEKK